MIRADACSAEMLEATTDKLVGPEPNSCFCAAGRVTRSSFQHLVQSQPKLSVRGEAGLMLDSLDPACVDVMQIESLSPVQPCRRPRVTTGHDSDPH